MSDDQLDMATVLASTVHDAKNSLGLISNQLDDVMTELKGTNPEHARQLKRILLESNRINSALTHMLGVYKVDNQLLHPALDEVLVMEVLEDAASRYAGSLKQQNIQVDIQCEDEDMVWIMDEALINNVLTNIMTNAIRYTRDWIGLIAFEENGQLCICIDDNGDGYPDALLNCLAPDASLKVKTSSTGLGVYFAHRIAELHVDKAQGRHGRIELINKENGGGRFALWLP